MEDIFNKYGFRFNRNYEEWWSIKGDLVIFEGLGMESLEDGSYLTTDLYTLCKQEDIGDSTKIIFRGDIDEMGNYLKKIDRKEKLKKLIG